MTRLSFCQFAFHCEDSIIYYVGEPAFLGCVYVLISHCITRSRHELTEDVVDNGDSCICLLQVTFQDMIFNFCYLFLDIVIQGLTNI